MKLMEKDIMKILHLHALVIVQKLQENILKIMNVLNLVMVIKNFIIMVRLNVLMIALIMNLNINHF